MVIISKQGCNCQEIKRLLEITDMYLGSLQDTILQGKEVLRKDHKDISELRKIVKETLEKDK